MKFRVGALIENMLGMLSMVQPLVSGVAAAFRQLGLQFLTLHKAVAKLGYIVTSLLSGVTQEGFCTATESEETEAGRQVTQTQYWYLQHPSALLVLLESFCRLRCD